MGLLRSTMVILQSRCGHCSTCLASIPSSGLQRCFTRSISTTIWDTPSHAKLLLKATLASSHLSSLKLFGAHVCIYRTGKRHGKLDHHNFSGIFLGYLSTDQHICYLDLLSGVVKTSHHAQFNEAWYLQHEQPPGPQLLYDLGLEADGTFFSKTCLDPESLVAKYPSPIPKDLLYLPKFTLPHEYCQLHLPLWVTATPPFRAL
jgi:hypothetical protein